MFNFVNDKMGFACHTIDCGGSSLLIKPLCLLVFLNFI